MKKRRPGLRLPGYDYSAQGGYFVTMVTKNRRPFFGEIIEAEMVLSAIGRTTVDCWEQIPRHHPHAKIDVLQVMPDHLHGILFLVGQPAASGTVQLNSATGGNRTYGNSHYYSEISPGARTLGVIIRTFKAAVTT